MNLNDLKYRSNNFTKYDVYTAAVTPKLAAELLTLNTNNRPVRDRKVKQYTETMLAGKWKELNGDTIRISKTCKILQGQHTLLAIVASGKTFKYPIMTGLNDDVFSTIDCGTARSGADTLAHRGLKNATYMATLVKQIISLEINKDFDKISRKTVHNQDIDTYMDLVSPEELERIQKAASKASGFNKAFGPLSVAQASFFYWLFSGINQEKCDEFMYLLTTGDGVGKEKHSAIWVLRKKMQDHYGKNYNIDTFIRNAWIIKAWNAYRKNKPVSRIDYSLHTNEEYPKAI